MNNWFKPFLDGLSLATIMAAFLKMLPHLATLASLMWMLIRIYETDTVQKFLRTRRRRKKA